MLYIYEVGDSWSIQCLKKRKDTTNKIGFIYTCTNSFLLLKILYFDSMQYVFCKNLILKNVKNISDIKISTRYETCENCPDSGH